MVLELTKLEAPLDETFLRRLRADLDAAVALGAPRLLYSLLQWVAVYCRSRGMRKPQLEALLGDLLAELQTRAPWDLGRSVPIEPTWRPFSPLRPLAERYVELVLMRDGVGARALILEQARSRSALRRLYARVLDPALKEIGQRWLENLIDVSDEHFATAVTQAVLADLRSRIPPVLRPRGRVLCAAIEGELHDLGLKAVADLLTLDGWEAIYYGASLPLPALRSAIAKTRPDLLCLSVTIPARLLDAADAIRRVRGIMRDEPLPILVGGYPFLLDPSLCAAVGADCCAADAARAVRAARMLRPSLRPRLAA